MKKRIFLAIIVLFTLIFSISIINCLLSGTIRRGARGTGLEEKALISGGSTRTNTGEPDAPDGASRQYAGVVAETELGHYFEYAGVMHIHTVFSDGGGTYAEIGAVADSLGLDFIVPSDHNYVKSILNNPLQRVGRTLVVPGVEITPRRGYGHFLVLGDSVPPVPRGLASPDSAYLAAVAQGNAVYIAHPFTRAYNSWSRWELGRYTGFELFNLDANWRNTFSLLHLNRFLAGIVVYFFRDDAMTYILSYPRENMEKFDRDNTIHKVVGIGSTDAHSRIRLWKGFDIRFPSYPSMFKQVQTVIVTRERFNGQYDHDRRLLLHSLRSGNAFVAFAGLEDGRGFNFSAVSDSVEASLGDSLRLGRSANLRVDSPDSVNTVVRILRDGVLMGEYRNRGRIDLRATEPGSYRVEVFQERVWLPFFRKHSFPWIFSNPIYLYR